MQHLAACCAFALVALLVSPKVHAVAVTVEVADGVDEFVDVPLARRLIRLELADVELPKVNGAVPGTHATSGRPATPSEVVFVRLLRQGDGLAVELWARGELSGERRLTVSSNQQHQARRVALASAELTRRLREVRVVERQRHLRRHLAPNVDGPPAYATKVNVEGGASLAAAFWLDADSVLVGPKVSLGAVAESGVGLGLFAGSFTSTDASVFRSWSELGARPSFRAKLAPSLELSVGLDVAVGLLDMERMSSFVGSETSHQTWQAKVGLDAQLRWLVTPRVNLMLAPDAALFVRTLRVERERVVETLDGLWLGAAVGALVYL